MKAFDSSHSICSASRAFFADQKLFAITATPDGIAKIFFTPLIFFAFAASNDLSFAPNRGGMCYYCSKHIW